MASGVGAAFRKFRMAFCPGKGLNNAIRAHGLAVDEERRQAGSIETCQQAVDDDDDIELVFPDLIDFLLAG